METNNSSDPKTPKNSMDLILYLCIAKLRAEHPGLIFM